MRLLRRLLGRLLVAVATLWALSALLFALLTSIPGNAVDMLVTSNPGVRPEDVTRLVRLRGLDRPWYVQYARWLLGHAPAVSPPSWDGGRELPPDAVLPLRATGRAPLRFRVVDGDARVDGDQVRVTGTHAVLVMSDALGQEGAVVLGTPPGRWRPIPVAVPPDPARAEVDLSAWLPADAARVSVVDGPGRVEGRTWRHAFTGPGQSVVVLEAVDAGGGAARAALVVDHGPVPDPARHEPGLLEGGLGFSSTYKQPVADILEGRVEATLELLVPALLISLLLSLLLGVLAARRPGSALDRACNAAAYVAMSVPAFWLGVLLVIVFAVTLRWLPPGGRETPGDGSPVDLFLHAVLPVTVLCCVYTGRFLRHVRGALLEVMRQDHVRTSRSLGIPERVILWKHALRNALVPVVNVFALSVPSLFSGAVLTETVFSWPGMGRLVFDSVLSGDHYVAMIAFLLSAALVMAANAAADALCAVLDPRTREAP